MLNTEYHIKMKKFYKYLVHKASRTTETLFQLVHSRSYTEQVFRNSVLLPSFFRINEKTGAEVTL